MKPLLFFGLFWSLMVLGFDCVIVAPAIRQVLSLRFPATEGVILSSEVMSNCDGDGCTHGVAIRYSYSVNGTRYEGNRYRYDTSMSSDSEWARQAVAERTPGTKVQVYYNPANPDDSLLVPAILGSDLFLLAFMTPFNAAMLGFMWLGWSKFRQARFKPVAGGVRITVVQGVTHARLTTFSPLASFVAVVALMAFLSIFAVGFIGGGGFHPPLRTMLITWAVIIAGGLAAALWHWARIRSGRYDLILDERDGTMDLPLTSGRKIRRRVRLDEIQDIWVKTVRKPSASDEEAAPTYAPTLVRNEPEASEEKMVEWHNEEKAQAFVNWLNARRTPPKKTAKRPLAGRF